MRNALLAFAVLLSLGLRRHRCRGRPTTPSTSTRRSALAPGGTLRLKNFSGRVTITGTRPAGRVDRRRPPRDARAPGPHQARHPSPRVRRLVRRRQSAETHSWSRSQQQRGRDRLRPSRCRGGPASTSTLFSSPARRSKASKARTTVHGFSSRVRLDDVTGPVRVHTFSGHGRHPAPGSWEPEPAPIDVDTFSGSVRRCTSPTSRRGHASIFNSFSGHLNSDDAADPAYRQSAVARDADLGSGSGSTRCAFKTFSGSVRIDR